MEPTLKNSGLTQGMHCAVCGRILVRQTVIPAASSESDAPDDQIIAPGAVGRSICDEIGHDYSDGYCLRCWEPCPHADINVLISGSKPHHFVCNDCGERVMETHTVQDDSIQTSY